MSGAANVQPENPIYDDTVLEWEPTDPVQGGRGGVANTPLLSLSNRTNWLRQQLLSLIAGNLIPPTVAPLNGPNFTGSPRVPNVAPGDDSTLIANTDFVQTANSGIATVTLSPTGTTVLTQAQWGVGIILLQGAITAANTVVFPTQHGRWIVANLSTGAFNVTCKTAGGAGVILPRNSGSLGLYSDGAGIRQQDTILTRSGEVLSSDLAPTGVTAATYTLATIAVGADGRITAASSAVNVSLPGTLTAIGNIGSGGLLRAVNRATGSGDPNAATLLADFPLVANEYTELPNGLVLLVGSGRTVTGQDFVTFPDGGFPTTGLHVFAQEANPEGWLAGGAGQFFSTTFGCQQVGRTSFAMYCMRTVPNAPPILGAGVSYRYWAWGV